jgi:hypothetical protein
MICHTSSDALASPRQLVLLLAVWLTLWAGPAWGAPRVQVRGASRVEMQAFGPADRITVTGTVRDEVGAPIPRARIMLGAVVDGDVPVPWSSMHPCGRGPEGSFSEHTDHAVEVDDGGSWCVIGSLGRSHASMRAVFGGDGLHDGTRTEIVWDAAQRAMTLSFAPRPDRLDLDQARHKIFARVTTPPDVAASGLAIELKDDRGPLGSSSTDGVGLAVFDLESAKLGGPGIGSLVVTYPGSTALSATSSSTSVTRFAKVKLAPERERLQGDPAAGLHLRVGVTTSRGPVSEGSVEALFGSDVVGTAVVSDGVAEVPLAFPPPRGAKSVNVSLRYVADAPFYVASEPVVLTLQLVRASPVWRFVPVVLAAAVAAWLLRGWRRPKRLERADPERSKPTGVASVEVVGARSTPHWEGRVLDAHDGVPLGGARVRVIAPSFVDLDVVVETHTADDGVFAFDLRSASRDLRLRVESPLHTDLEKPLPPPADLVISMVSRRRMLLQRLVEWARRAGKPWDHAPEPTPGHVVRVAASQHRRDEISAWAESVEHRAYGPEPVDSRAEREVKALEPGRHGVR